jgi:hypothetical protein
MTCKDSQRAIECCKTMCAERESRSKAPLQYGPHDIIADSVAPRVLWHPIAKETLVIIAR